MDALLAILADGEFYSGNKIGQELGITRAAVWKRIKQLEIKLGQRIQSVPGKGYRLQQPLNYLDIDLIRQHLPSVAELVYAKEIDSTNAEAKRLIKRQIHDSIVLSESQTEGQGRRGRQWQSPYATNLYMSYVLPITQGMQQIEGLSLSVGLAINHAIKEFGIEGTGLKWPNDVLISNKKVAGILLELVGDPADQCFVVIGVGVNINMQLPVQEIEQAWTSLALELGRPVERSAFTVSLIQQLDDVLQAHLEGGFSRLKSDWEAAHLWQNKRAVLSMAGRKIEGIIRGVNDRGELAFEQDGCIGFYAGGELSLRLSDDS